MKKLNYALFLLFLCFKVSAQREDSMKIRLTLKQAIEMAHKHSPDILVARHAFRSLYWNYCYFKANYLPSLTFSSTPNYNHSINPITMADGSTQFVGQNQVSTNGTFTLNQNVSFTGGSFFLKTSLNRLDMLDSKTHQYQSSPILVGYQQALFGYNRLKWDKKIEPLKFEEAKRSYVESLELVSVQTTNKFFNLVHAQTNLDIAKTNCANADTLYAFAQGRYNIGTITENEMLQLEVNRLNEESNMLNAQADVDNSMQELHSYLGLQGSEQIEVVLDEDIPKLTINLDKALQLAMENSPNILDMERRQKESESAVALSKANRGLKANLYMQFGLTQTGFDIHTAYAKPQNQQSVEIGIIFPILDWGRSKGQVRVAESNRDMVSTQIEQDRNNFKINIEKIVKQFNIQSTKVDVAVKMDYTAQRRGDVARKLYILGKSTILDLNASISEKDAAKRNHIDAISNYWALYYTLRSLTLYDFEKSNVLMEDYKLLLK